MGVIKKTNRVNINNPVEVYDKILDNNEGKSFTEYSKHLESNPIFVTYYNQDLVKSTTDIGLQAPNSLLGDESPISYNRINKLPLYSVPVTQLSMDIDSNIGIKLDYSADGVILPGTIIPKPGDFFIIPIVGKEYLFKVTSVNADTVRSNNYFKIEFTFDKINDGSIDKNTDGDYSVIYNNIGDKDSKAVIRNDHLVDVNNMVNIIYEIRNNILNRYFDRDINLIIYKKSYYDPWINDFIKQNNLLNHESFRDIVFICNRVVDDEDRYMINYKTSFLELLKAHNPHTLSLNNNIVVPMGVNKIRGNIFDVYKGNVDIYELTKIPGLTKPEPRLLTINEFKPCSVSEYLDSDFIYRVVNNKLYTISNDNVYIEEKKIDVSLRGINTLRNKIISFMHNTDEDFVYDNIINSYEEMIYNPCKSYKEFDELIIGLSIIYILKTKINILLDKN